MAHEPVQGGSWMRESQQSKWADYNLRSCVSWLLTGLLGNGSRYSGYGSREAAAMTEGMDVESRRGWATVSAVTPSYSVPGHSLLSWLLLLAP